MFQLSGAKRPFNDTSLNSDSDTDKTKNVKKMKKNKDHVLSVLRNKTLQKKIISKGFTENLLENINDPNALKTFSESLHRIKNFKKISDYEFSAKIVNDTKKNYLRVDFNLKVNQKTSIKCAHLFYSLTDEAKCIINNSTAKINNCTTCNMDKNNDNVVVVIAGVRLGANTYKRLAINRLKRRR